MPCRPSDAAGRAGGSRFAMATAFVGLFMVVGALIRLGLFVLDADRALHQPWPLAQALGLGALYDLAVARWWALPLTLPA